MTPIEKRAIVSLSSIMSLRMIGLFMVLPVFTLYASQLEGATPFLIGLAVGIYGLFQAIFQIPFGSLSDRLGRKPIICFGLLLFCLGSLIAACSHTIAFMLLGRALQGAGAVGGTLLALAADLTPEEERTKAMAIMGMTIGFAFSIAMLIGPLLTTWMPVNGLFLVAMSAGLLAIFLLWKAVPTPTTTIWRRDAEPELHSIFTLLIKPELAKLYSGIFILHALFTASFVVIPIGLYKFAGLTANKQWTIYLPILLGAFLLSLICIGMAEKSRQLKRFFILGILLLLIAECLLWQFDQQIFITGIALCLFFTGFSLLEAFLPSLISRTAPVTHKGSALGIFSCAQFFGIFVGGAAGGWLYGKFSFAGVYFFCIMLTLLWLIIALLMQAPRYLTIQLWRISPSLTHHWENIATKLRAIPGMVEVTFIAEESIAYLKMERDALKHPDFISLKEQTVGYI